MSSARIVRGGRKSRQQRSFVTLGVFAVVAMALLYLVYLAITHFEGSQGYRIGVRFANASGLAAGAPVYVSGVSVGQVQSVQLLPNNSVEVILAIYKDIDIPKAARITIHSPVAGSPDVTIIPPPLRLAPGASAAALPPQDVLPKRILPISEQPEGKPPLSAQELIAQSQALFTRSSQIMNRLKGAQSAMKRNLNDVRANSSAALAQGRALPAQLRSDLAQELTAARSEIASASAALHRRGGSNLSGLSNTMRATAISLDATMTDLRAVRSNPDVRSNMRASADNVARSMSTMRRAAIDLQGVTSNAQVRAELRDAGAHLHAAMQKLHSLLSS